RGEEGTAAAAGGRKTGAGAAVGGVGVPLATGPAEDLRVTEDGRFATYLTKTRKPTVEGIPPQMRLGELYVVPVDGGVARRLGDGVTNVPGGQLFTPDSKHVLFLSGYNLANQSGVLHVLDLGEPTAEPRKLGETVTYFVPSHDGKQLAFVDGGVLKLGALPGGPFRQVGGEVSTAGFSPDGATLFFKRKLGAGGGLLAVAVAPPADKPAEPRKLADQVGDFVSSPDAKFLAYQVRTPGNTTYDLYVASPPEWTGKKVATGTTSFAFSPDSQWLARNDGGKPEQMGDLYVGPASGEPGRKVGERVKDVTFSPDSKALGFLAKYDQSAGAGLMGVVSLPEGEPKLVGSRVPNFIWGKDGQFVAYLSRFLKPVYSVDLMIYPVGAEKARKAQAGVFGYGFVPDGSALVFRSACIREGRACDFQALSLPPSEAQPATWLQGIYSYKLSGDGARVLATSARVDSDAFDVSVYDVKTGARKTLDQGAQLPAYFAGPDDSLAVYILKGANAGVYAAPARP
ncbi:MAG: gliding motility protein, partial [Cystobacter sp.]